jgi:hypothetical protein
MGFQRIIMEGDALVIVKALNSDGDCPENFASLIEDTRLLLNCFSSWRVNFVRRECKP